MARRTKKTKQKKSSLLARIFVVGAVSCVVIALVGQQMEITDLRNQQKQNEDKIAIQTGQNQDLERINSMSDDKEFLENVAREDMGYGYSDERVFVDDSGN